MKRRVFIGLIGGAAAAWPLSAHAQQPGKVALIARLHPGFPDDSAVADGLRAFEDGLRTLGHIEGQTYRLEARYSEGNPARLPVLAAELAALKPDVIVAVADDAVGALKAATATIPIVMAMSTRDPVGARYIENLARPGGNVTGFTGQVDELNAKQVELLYELVLGLTDIAILYNSASPVVTRERLDQITKAGATLGLKVRQAGISHPMQLEAALGTGRAGAKEAVIVLPEPGLMDQNRIRIAEIALRHRRPTVFTFRMYVEAGGLMSYAQDLPDMHRRSAVYVDKILKGAKPAELPVQQPTKFELVINLKTAKALGLDIPPTLLARADEVIE